MQAVIAVVLLAIAAGVALWLERRRHATALPTPATAPVPQQLQRADFARPDAPWLVVLFSSSTCDGCKPMAEKVRALESADVAVVVVEYSSDPELHARYGIEAVPIVVVADHEGVTRTSFAGTATATDLWAAVAELRA